MRKLWLAILLYLIGFSATGQSEARVDGLDMPPFGYEIFDLTENHQFAQAQKLIDSMSVKYGDGIGYEVLRIKLRYEEEYKKEAREKMSKLVQLHPNNCHVVFTHALILAEDLEYPLADSMFRKAYRLCGNQPGCTYLVGLWHSQMLLCQGAYKEAIPLLETNVIIAPTSFSSQEWLGYSYLHENQLENALKYLKLALELKKTVEVQNAIGFIYNLQGKYKKSINLFEKLIKQDPSSYYIFCNLGYAYAQTNNVEKGLQMMHKAQEIEPERPYIYRNLGITYLQLNDTTKACEYFDKALEHGFSFDYGNEVLELQQKHCK